MGFLATGESIDTHRTLKPITQVLSYQSLPSIYQSVSPHPPISSDSYNTDFIPMTFPISISTSTLSNLFSIPLSDLNSIPTSTLSDSSPITCPSFYFNSISTSNSSSQPSGLPQDLFQDFLQDSYSDFTLDQFPSLPQNLIRSSDEILLPIYLTHIPNSDHPDPIPIYISAKKKYKPVHLKVKPVFGDLPDKF